MLTIPEFLIQNFWAGWAIFMVLYISDYTFTFICARLYYGGVREKIVFEGSYELNPYFQADIDSLRRVSPRFIRAALLISFLMFVAWWLAAKSQPEMYSFLLGALVLIQLAIHKRHIGNFFLFRAAATDAVCGRIEYSRAFVLRHSALDLLLFAGLYFALFAFAHSWFLLGGSIACLAHANKHWKLAREHVQATAKASAEAAAD